MVNSLASSSPFSNTTNDTIQYKMVVDELITENNLYRHNEWYKTISRDLLHIKAVIKFCITHSAQQFNFWYGNNNYKPFSGRTIVSALLRGGPSQLKKEIKNSCLGFIPERLHYIDECKHFDCDLDKYINLEEFIDKMLDLRSFNQDPFFKKGLLAIMEIRRILDNFYDKTRTDFIEADKFFSKELIDQFPIPADYRIPEWLANQKLLNGWMFLNKEFQPNSIYETFLRASTIREVDELSKVCNLAPYQLDGLIFMNKSETNDFHMCMTTAY